MNVKLRTVLLIASAGVASTCWLVGCGVAPSPEQVIVEQVATALGGVERVRAVRAISVAGQGDLFALGQNRTLDGPLLNWHVTPYRRVIDFDHGRWRDAFTQTAAFVTGWPEPTPVVAGYDNDVAFDVDEGHASRLDAITARDQRAELFHHPIGFLRAALTAGARLDHARVEGDDEAVDLTIANGERFTLFADRQTHLPRRIVSQSHVATLGDVNVSTSFDAFIDVIDADAQASTATGRLKVPGRMITRIDGTVITDLTFTTIIIDPPVNTPGELEAPADVRTAAASHPARVTVEEVAPGIWYLAGEGHHSVVAELPIISR